MALLTVVAGLAIYPAVLAQEEPSLFEDEEELEEEAAPAEDLDLPNAGLSIADPPLSKNLDFERWREMSGRERQAFVEGAVLTLESIASNLRATLPADGRTPPGQLAYLVKFVGDHHPRRPVTSYLREMDSIYRTAAGQQLSIHDCFRQAFQRLNRH
jgi:hypothetical protein